MLHWPLGNIEYFLYFISLIIYLISSKEFKLIYDAWDLILILIFNF